MYLLSGTRELPSIVLSYVGLGSYHLFHFTDLLYYCVIAILFYDTLDFGNL